MSEDDVTDALKELNIDWHVLPKSVKKNARSDAAWDFKVYNENAASRRMVQSVVDHYRQRDVDLNNWRKQLREYKDGHKLKGELSLERTE
jgi:hypothetical protein